MKFLFQTLLGILFLGIFPFLFSCISHSNEEREVSNVVHAFLVHLYSCDFENSSSLCTESGEAEVKWFASNLSDDELALVVRSPKIKTGHVEFSASVHQVSSMSESSPKSCSDSLEDETCTKKSASVLFEAEDVLVLDSLDRMGHIGSQTGTVLLEKRGGKWLVQGLKW